MEAIKTGRKKKMGLPLTGVGATEAHARLLVDSYRKWTGKELLELVPGKSLGEQLYLADTVILSHGTETDPVLNYGNRKGLELWELSGRRSRARPPG
jgi:hypothetical protein